MHSGPVERLGKTPEELDKLEAQDEAIAAEWAPPGGWPTVSERARKVIESLQQHPGLLREVALHFEHGWPTANLIEPWQTGNHNGVPVLARLSYAELVSDQSGDNPNHDPVAVIAPLLGDGFDGSQWVATTYDPQNLTSCLKRRILDSITEALAWCDQNLTTHDPNLVLTPLTDTSKLSRDYETLAKSFNIRVHYTRKIDALKKQATDGDPPTLAELATLADELRSLGLLDQNTSNEAFAALLGVHEMPF